MSQITLRISEIFYSLQGESVHVGVPTTFIRLTGCPLRCTYCDTAYAFKGGRPYALDAILARCESHQTNYVCVTGGEPLAQRDVHVLLTALCDRDYNVSLETSGALAIAPVDPRVQVVMDWKAPSSHEASRNLVDNLAHLKPHDQIKFVLGDEADFRWACSELKKHALVEKCGVLFSPVHDRLQAAQLAEWILANKLAVRMQVQLHKYLWGDKQGC